MAHDALADGIDALIERVEAGHPVAIVTAGQTAAVALPGRAGVHIAADALRDALGRIEAARPRWVWWSNEPATTMLAAGIRVARCWDLAATHRLIVGGWVADASQVWAHAHGLDLDAVPTIEPVDLFTQATASTNADEALRADGYLAPEWVAGSWAEIPARQIRWAELALDVYARQNGQLAELAVEPHAGADRSPSRVRDTALSESAAELICAELEHDGLPFDRGIGEQIVAGFIGSRPADAADEGTRLAELDHIVLRHLPSDADFDLRRPDHVKSLLRRVGIEVPDTRAWRLEGLRDAHPIVESLLRWRRAERVRTTFGYQWIDEHVGADNRLRGRWHGSDGAAGRMTATVGLHNMPAEMRPAVVAPPGRRLVRADLGQIEPRVLAAVSGDERLIHATHDDDMYAPVATRLAVKRSVAKVAVLGAMYGQTTGIGAEALRGLEREYPVAMGYLRTADESAQGGHDLRTYGGRLIRMSGTVTEAMSARDVRARAAARGRFGRNAMVQGAAAEFFKSWAALVRARGTGRDLRIVLCLHDELIIDTDARVADATVRLVEDCLIETAQRWSPANGTAARFVADISVVERWSDAK